MTVWCVRMWGSQHCSERRVLFAFDLHYIKTDKNKSASSLYLNVSCTHERNIFHLLTRTDRILYLEHMWSAVVYHNGLWACSRKTVIMIMANTAYANWKMWLCSPTNSVPRIIVGTAQHTALRPMRMWQFLQIETVPSCRRIRRWPRSPGLGLRTLPLFSW